MLNITSMFCSFATCKSWIVNWFRTELNYIFGNISYCNCIYFHLYRCKPFFGIQIKKWFLDFHIASNFVLWQHLFYFILFPIDSDFSFLFWLMPVNFLLHGSSSCTSLGFLVWLLPVLEDICVDTSVLERNI